MLYSKGNQLWRSRLDAAIGGDWLKIPPFPTSTAPVGVLTQNTFCSKTLRAVSGAQSIWFRPTASPRFCSLPCLRVLAGFIARRKDFALHCEARSRSDLGTGLIPFRPRAATTYDDSWLGGPTTGRWSPDGRSWQLYPVDQSAIQLLDLTTHRWTQIARGAAISFPVWSPDSVLYFQDILAPGEPVYRFQPGSGALQRAYSFEDILQAGAMRCAFWAFAPDGSLLVQVNRGGGDIYALQLIFPSGKSRLAADRAARLPRPCSPQTTRRTQLTPHIAPPAFDAGETHVRRSEPHGY